MKVGTRHLFSYLWLETLFEYFFKTLQNLIFISISRKSCKEFTFGGCEGNGNRYTTQSECESVCLLQEEPLASGKFFIMSTEFDKNISDWRYDCTDHKNGFDFFMRLVKWPKIAVKKCQNLIFKVNFQRQKSSESFYFWPFNKSEEKIKVIFVMSAIILSIRNVFIKFRWHDEKLTTGLCTGYFCSGKQKSNFHNYSQ